MTRSSPTTRPFAAAGVLDGQALRVTWAGLVARDGCAARTEALVVTTVPGNGDGAVLEAWVETPAGRRSIVAPQPVRCEIVRDDGLLHVDISLGGRCALAVTLDETTPAGRPLYARTDLLDEAGLAPGTYDPPTADVLAADEIAARSAS